MINENIELNNIPLTPFKGGLNQHPPNPLQRGTKSKIAWLIATVGGIGKFPVGPGTVGTIPGVILWWLTTLLPFSLLIITIIQLLLFVLIFLVGLWSSTIAEKVIGKKDPSEVVIDEAVSPLITFLGIATFSWTIVLIGFVLNRIFDIWKPYPINRLQDFKSGWGIMIDDVASAIVSAVFLQVIIYFFI